MNGNKNKSAVKAKHPLLVLEDALVLCQFGRFHKKLMLASLVSSFAFMLVTASSSYLLPNTECDLNMTIMQKGLLNAGPSIGFVLASILSVFFVDAYGRKPFLVGGHAAIFVFTLLEASSQSYWSLLLMKVLEGASSILCLIAMLTHIAELTHKGARNRMGMFTVSFSPLAHTGGALIAWGLLPHHEWRFIVWQGYFELHAWNIYLYVCSVFSLIATLLYSSLPESPKYLLFQGKELEALDILKNIYSVNTGNYKDTFPIKALDSFGILPSNRITIKARILKYLCKLKGLFQKPLVHHMMLFLCFGFVSHMVLTIGLWYPQISTIVENYRKEHGNTERFCTMMNDYTDKYVLSVNNLTVSEVCSPAPSGPETYMNIIVINLISFFAINFTGYFVDYVGQKLLMFTLFILCAVSSGALYFTSSSYQIALLLSGISVCMKATLALKKTTLVILFPTSVRALGLSIVIMISRVGSVLGNILFPILLQVDCVMPFLAFSIILLSTSTLVYFIPSKKNNVTVKNN